MNIAVNAVLEHVQPRGPGNYLNNLIEGIAERDHKNQYYVFYGKWMEQYGFLKIDQPNIHLIALNISQNRILKNLYLAAILPLKCIAYHIDTFFLVDTQAIFYKTCRLVSTIHDLAEYELPDKYPEKQAMLRRWIVRYQAKLSDHIMTVSEYSKRALCKRFHLPDSKVTVTYNIFRTSGQIIHTEPKSYFLFVSEVERAKNLPLLLEAFFKLPDQMQKDFEIRVVGRKGNDFERVENLIQQMHLENKVHFYGYVSNEELRLFYAECYAFIFPSFFEGFGFPVLEAMGNGVPVICSNAASIPEVGGNAVMTFDPNNAEELRNQMQKLIASPDLRRQMIEAGLKRAEFFSTNDSIEDTIKILTMNKK